MNFGYLYSLSVKILSLSHPSYCARSGEDIDNLGERDIVKGLSGGVSGWHGALRAASEKAKQWNSSY